MYLYELALHKFSKNNLQLFFNTIIAMRKSKDTKQRQLISKIFFAIPETDFGIPASTYFHDYKKHNTEMEDWNNLCANITNPIIVQESKKQQGFKGKNYLCKYNFNNKFWGVAYCQTNIGKLITTFFQSTEKGIDTWIEQNKKAQPRVPSVSNGHGSSSSDELNTIISYRENFFNTLRDKNVYENEVKDMNAKQLIEKLKQVIINPKEEDFWDEMEDETGMNKVSENVVSMFDYKYKQEDLMEKFIRKYLKNDDYYTLYKVAKMLSSMNKLYLEKNLDVKLSDKEYNELKDDLKDLVRLGDESLNEEVSSAQLGTAPSPSLGQVTVNGKPWTSGKSYKAKRKKKIKETSDSTLFSIEYKNEKNEYKTIRVNIEQLNQIIKYPSTITIDNFYSIIDTLLTNRNLFESPSDFRGDVVMFRHSDYNDINTEDVVEAIAFFNAIASESDLIFDDPEKSYDFWVHTEGKTRQFYKYPSIREYQERQPAQFSFYYHILYNAQSDRHLMMSAIKKVYPEIHDRIEREREEERLRKEKEQKERDKKDIQYQNAMKEFKKIKTASDFCKFLSKYEGKAYIEGYVNAYTSSDNQELVTATRITVSYINDEWNIATTNYIREYGRIGTDSFDNTTEDHVLRIVKGAWIGEYANEGTKFEIYSLGRVFRNTIGSIKENYTTLNKLKNIIKMAESLNEQEVYGTISEQVAEWLDKLSFKNVDTKEGIVYKKEGNYKHLVKYNNQDDIIEYRITKDGNIVYNNKWTISSPEQVSVIFKEINKEYEGHE